MNLLIDASEATPSELMSGVRQMLRSISDVQIVYDIKEADLVISILGYEDKMADSRAVGYTASTTTAAPCMSKLGTNEWNFLMHENHFLQSSGKDVKVLVEDIVTTLDSKDIENLRRQHESMKKYLREQKK